jgi:3-deoxy-manno-octulosonate cytidylyltransferase (CMP-KDO synthetase)
MKVLGVIPVRYHSSRFPAKALADIGGKSMVQRVYEQACQANKLDKVIVATDDERIYQHLEDMGCVVEMTSVMHQSGTDRCAEVANRHPSFQIVINIQGDEPFIQPQQIDKVIEPFFTDQQPAISTLAKKIDEEALLFNPNVVKVVVNRLGNAIYFSRATIPFVRQVESSEWLNYAVFFKHIGLYGFQREDLLNITQLPISALEKTESLEQLRWLDNGYTIAVSITDTETYGIDTPADLENVKKIMGISQ